MEYWELADSDTRVERTSIRKKKKKAGDAKGVEERDEEVAGRSGSINICMIPLLRNL